MKKELITILRNKKTTTDLFRQCSEQIGFILANEASSQLSPKSISVETPLTKTTGSTFSDNIVLVPILRSGIALLDPFLKFFPKANVGFVGLRRDEKTAIAQMYYYKVPPITPETEIIILDPMIATGGSGLEALRILKEAGASEDKIVFAAIIAAPEGIKKIQTAHLKIKIVVIQVDEKLNDQKFIVPGLGDFGDRYFGTPDATCM
ncbi:uracil phosphoribosyltransferase [Candidatus Babeliales bacterium]|nr:uracil phosphoribosyltransferase [Candidatus Babeliales bacterium]